jgi:hypothetical protein
MPQKIILTIIIGFFLFFTGCSELSNDLAAPDAPNPKGIFTLTDAPRDELSVLTVELTELKIKDVEENTTVIFSEADGETFVLDLLNLEGINELLGSIPLAAGFYKEMTLSYKNAVALDPDGSALTVLPQHFGTAKMLLNPYLYVDEDNVFIEIDFDLNNSVYDIVAGPHGHLMLMPTLIVKINDYGDGDPELDEFKGEVVSVESMSLVVSLNDGQLNVSLSDTTVVEVDELIVTPETEGFDLTALIFPGNLVEVKGTLDVETNTVTASYIERKFENHGPDVKGLVVALAEDSFDMLVLDPEDSGFELGSTQTISYDDNTFFLFTDPCQPAAAELLALGQKVRVTGLPDNPAFAQKVKLCETKLIGTVLSINSSLNQITLEVARIQRVSIDAIPDFVNPVVVEFEGEFPVDIAVDDVIEVEGHFNRVTEGVFTAVSYEVEDDDDDEEGSHATVVGKIYSLISASPLQISITRGGEGGNIEARTVTVVVEADTEIIERQQNNNSTMTISQEELIAGVTDKVYWKLKADGSYDRLTQILTAEKIIADIKKK